jgi:uncharacterized membrane protein
MNKLMFFALLALCISSASIVYTIDTDRSGLSSVTLSMEGEGMVSVPLPEDAKNIRIVGGAYSISNGSAILQAGSSGLATFSFESQALSSKAGQTWKLSFKSPSGAITRIYTPPYVTIENSFPQPTRVSSESSRTLFEFDSPSGIIYYRLDEPPAEEPSDNGLIFAAILLAAAILAGAYLLKGNRPPAHLNPSSPVGTPPVSKPATTALTPGKKEMMETFNENDLKIVSMLLESGGKSRRNDLERRSGISKSSLAMALNRLEKRKILEIDRTSTTHFVKLSDYFLRL